MSTVKINELGAGTPVSTDLVPFADPTTGLAEKATLTQVASVVEPLLTGKADLNGNSAEQFEVADATSSTQAVNKNQLDVAINALQGSLIPQGNWNASTNTPNISGTTTTGYYWIVSVAGSTNLDGITDWKVNDWAIKTATGWAKIDNSEPVTSVAGKTGAVTLDLDDVSDSATRFALTNTTQSIDGSKTFNNPITQTEGNGQTIIGQVNSTTQEIYTTVKLWLGTATAQSIAMRIGGSEKLLVHSSGVDISELLTANGGITSDDDLELTANGKVNVAKTLTTLDQKVTGEVQATSFVGDGSKLRNVQIESLATPSDQQLSYGNSEMQNYLRVQDAAGFNVDAPNSGGWTIAKDKKIGIRPSIRLIPSAIKTNILPSQLPRNGNGNFTFARTSTAQTVDFDGFIVTTGSGSPRIDYLDGEESLLLEPATTNLITYSEDFTDASWLKGNTTITSNSIISPDGTLTADTLTENATNSTHSVAKFAIIPSVGTWNLSFFVKPNGRTRVAIGGASGATDLSVFDLSSKSFIQNIGGAGSTLSNQEVDEYPNGWLRVSVTIVASGGISVGLYLIESGVTTSYLGDGTSGIYVWGAQLEQQSYATSYVRSLAGVIGVRNAETCNGAGTTAEINSQEGVLYFEGRALADDNQEKRLGIGKTGTFDAVRITYTPTSNTITAVVNISGTQYSYVYISVDRVDYHKLALKYKQNDFAFYVNGLKVNAQVGSGNTASPNHFDTLAFDVNNSINFYGRVKRLSVYNSALTDLQLEALTGFGSFSEMAQYLNYA